LICRSRCKVKLEELLTLRWNLIIGREPSSEVSTGMSHVYENGDEAYKLSDGSVKDTSFRVGALQYSILKLLAEHGLRQFTLHELWKALGVDRRRVYQAILYLVRRGVMVRIARGLYRLLVDPWELLGRAVIQGPNGRGVKDNHGTTPSMRAKPSLDIAVAGLLNPLHGVERFAFRVARQPPG
jgi:biotin operon repressor